MSALWPLPDRLAAWVGTSRQATPKRLPGPLGLPAYARLASTWAPIAPLEPRLRLLVTQLAAERSGCAYCAQHNRHVALKAGVPREVLEDVVHHGSAGHYSDAERAALELADAVTSFEENKGGLPMETLVRARCHFDEGQIVALVAAVSAEHFFDPATGRLGRDSLALPLP